MEGSEGSDIWGTGGKASECWRGMANALLSGPGVAPEAAGGKLTEASISPICVHQTRARACKVAERSAHDVSALAD